MHAGSYSKAAATLGLGKAVMSRQLTKLEDELGARLIQRSTRRLTLTAIGEPVFTEARYIDRVVAKIEVALTMDDHMVDLTAEHIDVALRVARELA